MIEIFLPIKDFENCYCVSNFGRVMSLHRKRILKPGIDNYGYEKVVLCNKGKRRTVTVHRLVAETFISNPYDLPTVNHINEIKTDNRVTNLEWLSIKDNDNYGTRNERMSSKKCKKPIEQILHNGDVVVFKGVKEASRKTGINRSCIAACCKNTRKTAGGYTWRYVNERN